MENIDVHNYVIVVLFLLCPSHNSDLSILLFFICSDGVGRSGTVMAIDFCYIVNVRGFVRKMREQRNYMVQTEVSFTQVVGQPSQTPPLSLICCHLHPLTFLHTLATIHIHPLCPLGGYCVWGHFLCPE